MMSGTAKNALPQSDEVPQTKLYLKGETAVEYLAGHSASIAGLRKDLVFQEGTNHRDNYWIMSWHRGDQ